MSESSKDKLTKLVNVYGIGCRAISIEGQDQFNLRVGTSTPFRVSWDADLYLVEIIERGKGIKVTCKISSAKELSKEEISVRMSGLSEFCASMMRCYPYNRMVKRGVLVIDEKGLALLSRKSNESIASE